MFFHIHATRENAVYILMQEKLLTFILLIKKLLTQIVGSHPIATGRFLALCVVYLGYSGSGSGQPLKVRSWT